MVFEKCERDAEVNPCYGLTTFIISQSDISHLICGGKLYATINGDEYAIEIIKEDEE